MNKARKTILIMLLTATLLASCAPQAVPSPTPDINAILTESVGTYAAYFSQTQTAMVTPATSTPLNTPTPIASSTPLSLPSPLPSATQAVFLTAIVYPAVTATGTQYTPTVNPSTLGYGCNNLGLINDLAISGGSTMNPGQSFIKEWQVANTGTCEWPLGYRVVFVSGSEMEGQPTRPNNTIDPGRWTRLHVNLTAPSRPGTYTGYWKLSDGGGHTFGSTLGVTITVRDSYP
jgi:hypothetical protein